MKDEVVAEAEAQERLNEESRGEDGLGVLDDEEDEDDDEDEL